MDQKNYTKSSNETNEKPYIQITKNTDLYLQTWKEFYPLFESDCKNFKEEALKIHKSEDIDLEISIISKRLEELIKIITTDKDPIRKFRNSLYEVSKGKAEFNILFSDSFRKHFGEIIQKKGIWTRYLDGLDNFLGTDINLDEFMDAPTAFKILLPRYFQYIQLSKVLKLLGNKLNEFSSFNYFDLSYTCWYLVSLDKINESIGINKESDPQMRGLSLGFLLVLKNCDTNDNPYHKVIRILKEGKGEYEGIELFELMDPYEDSNLAIKTMEQLTEIGI